MKSKEEIKEWLPVGGELKQEHQRVGVGEKD